MTRKKNIFLILLLLSLGSFIIVYFWSTNRVDLKKGDLLEEKSDKVIYSNDKYNYSLKFPSTWLLDYFGGSQEAAQGITLVSNKKDLGAGDGGPPLEVKVEIFVQYFKELAQVDLSFPLIETIDDWLEWERTYQVGFDSESLGRPKDEIIAVDGLRAIKSAYRQPLYPEDMGKSIRIIFLNPSQDYLFQIQYIGREPFFTQLEEEFDQIIKSFSFN